MLELQGKDVGTIAMAAYNRADRLCTGAAEQCMGDRR